MSAAFDRPTQIMLAGCFFAGGTGVGVWGANLPALGRRTGMDEAQIGLVLLCFAGAAIMAMNLVPQLIARLGTARVSCLALGLFGLCIMGVAGVGTMLQAALAAGMAGVSFGALDVAMNSHAAHYEARAGRPVLAFFHAMFSAGTLAAAGTYALRAHAGGAGGVSLVLAGALILGIALGAMALAGPAVPAGAVPQAAPSGTTRKAGVLALGAMAFAIFFAEGAIMDWAALYLVRILGASDSTGAMGYAVFAGAMLAGRLVGNGANRWLGAPRLFLLGTASVTLALAGLILAPSVPLALIALGLCGLGMANVIPILFSAAGRLGVTDGGKSMSRVLTMGYAGLLVGPAIMGFVAQAASLRFSLALVTLAVAATCLATGVIRRS